MKALERILQIRQFAEKVGALESGSPLSESLDS